MNIQEVVCNRTACRLLLELRIGPFRIFQVIHGSVPGLTGLLADYDCEEAGAKYRVLSGYLAAQTVPEARTMVSNSAACV